MNHVTDPMSSDGISIFSSEVSNFCYIKKCIYRLHFNTYILILLAFFELLKVIIINLVAILLVSAKLATLWVLKIKVFRN